MSPVTPKEQAMLNEQYKNLDGWQRAELILSGVNGLKLTENDVELIKNAVTEYMAWHKKQHPSNETCDHCDLVRDNIAMYNVLKFWVDHFQAMKNKK